MIDPVASTALLIRRPVGRVFEAFVDGRQVSEFWFTGSTGPLDTDAEVVWTFGREGVASTIRVRAIEANKRIVVDWDIGYAPTEIEWRFTPHGSDTYVEVFNRGFSGSPEEKVELALDAAGGFGMVLLGAKVWLEHGVRPGFNLDRVPSLDGWSTLQ